MGAVLTYHVRAGQLSATATGQAFYVPTHKDPSQVAAWEKLQELRAGKHTLWDHCFEPPPQDPGGLRLLAQLPAGPTIQRLSSETAIRGATQLGLYDWPGKYAQRIDGVDNRQAVQHRHPGSVIYVGDRQAGIFIHGWPPCHPKLCVVVLQRWDELMRVIASEAELSFAIVI